MNPAGAALVVLLLSVLGGAANAQIQNLSARSTWLAGVQNAMFKDTQRQFKTRYDGSIWAKSCKRPSLSSRLGLNRRELRSYAFKTLNAYSDIAKITALEKWILVNGVVNMADAYIAGGKGFVRASRQDCAIVLKGLAREFPQ